MRNCSTSGTIYHIILRFYGISNAAMEANLPSIFLRHNSPLSPRWRRHLFQPVPCVAASTCHCRKHRTRIYGPPRRRPHLDQSLGPQESNPLPDSKSVTQQKQSTPKSLLQKIVFVIINTTSNLQDTKSNYLSWNRFSSLLDCRMTDEVVY